MNVDLGRKFQREGRNVLAIPIGITRNEIVLTKFADLRNIPGWIVKEWEIREWRIEGFFKHENRLYLHGPHAEGLFLEEAIQRSFTAVIPYLIRLVDALVTLKRRNIDLQFIQTDSVYFLDEGGVLFLPAARADLDHE